MHRNSDPLEKLIEKVDEIKYIDNSQKNHGVSRYNCLQKQHFWLKDEKEHGDVSHEYC